MDNRFFSKKLTEDRSAFLEENHKKLAKAFQEFDFDVISGCMENLALHYDSAKLHEIVNEISKQTTFDKKSLSEKEEAIKKRLMIAISRVKVNETIVNLELLNHIGKKKEILKTITINDYLKTESSYWGIIDGPIRDIVKILELLNDVNLLSLKSLSEEICLVLLFESPSLFLKLLKNSFAEDPNFKMEFNPSNLSKYLYLNVNDKNMDSFLECLKFLKEKDCDTLLDFLKNPNFIETIIQHDNYQLFSFLEPSAATFNLMLNWNSPKICKQLVAGMLQDTNFSPEYMQPLLIKMIDNNAYKGFEATLEEMEKANVKLTNETLRELLSRPISQANILILDSILRHITLFENATREDTLKSFFMNQSEDNLSSFFQTLVRFSPLDKVEEYIQSYIAKENPDRSFIEKYTNEKEEFLKTAPFFSRYSRPSSLMKINSMYKNCESIDYATIAKRDYQYGLARRKKAEEILSKLETTEKTILTNPDLQEITKNIENPRFAFIVEAVSNWNFTNFKGEAADKDNFNTVRIEGKTETPITNQYKEALPLMTNVYHNSQAKDMEVKTENFYDVFYKTDKIINSVKLIEDTPFWGHSNQPLSVTWDRLEFLFDELWSTDLKKIDNAAEFDNEKLQKFYKNMAELMWLSGNTTPVARGSGSIAEFTFAILHMHHGLKIPILNLDYPQLDVLNINFPESDYEKLYPQAFYDSATLPEGMRIKNDPFLSVAEQMRQKYEAINQNALEVSMMLVNRGP